MRVFRSVTFLVLAGALAACADHVVQPGEYSRYSPTLPSYAFTHGGLGVDVRGADPDIVRGLMRPPAWAKNYALVPVESGAIAASYRVVLEINRASVSPCTTPALPGGPPEPLRGRVEIAATLCVFDQVRSSTSGHAADLSGTADPRLAALLGSIVEELLPVIEPRADLRGVCPGQGC